MFTNILGSKHIVSFHIQIETLKVSCHAIGKLWPQVFPGSSIPPKIDVLVFVVPEFAERWGTLGGHGEERIEALHQVIYLETFIKLSPCSRCSIASVAFLPPCVTRATLPYWQ